MKKHTGILLLLAAAAALLLSACAGTIQHRRQSVGLTASSGPETEGAVAQSPRPLELKVPLRVGIAFAPAADADKDLPSQLKQKLLVEVRAAFEDLAFVEAVEVIPPTFVARHAEYQGLAAAARTFRLDALALLTYDQEQFSATSNWSLLYWTVVGAYLVPGEKGETRTLLAASVLDLPSRSLLLHATGSDHASNRSSPVAVERAVREAGQASFERATAALIADLRKQLDRVQSDLREGRNLYGTPVVLSSPASKGGGLAGGHNLKSGDLGWLGTALACLLALAAGAGCRRRDA
jgi:rhombotail lipoprotein